MLQSSPLWMSMLSTVAWRKLQVKSFIMQTHCSSKEWIYVVNLLLFIRNEMDQVNYKRLLSCILIQIATINRTKRILRKDTPIWFRWISMCLEITRKKKMSKSQSNIKLGKNCISLFLMCNVFTSFFYFNVRIVLPCGQKILFDIDHFSLFWKT